MSDHIVQMTWLEWGIFWNVEDCPSCGSDSSQWTDPDPIQGILCICGYKFKEGTDFIVKPDPLDYIRSINEAHTEPDSAASPERATEK